MTNSELKFLTAGLKQELDYHAPDNSEIRLLLKMSGGGVCHCTLPPGQTSSAKKHRGVEEIWYVLEGEGEVWRKSVNQEETVRVSSGTCLTIPPGTSFQFRNMGANPLRILITTMPPWPGSDEAVSTDGLWPATATSPGS